MTGTDRRREIRQAKDIYERRSVLATDPEMLERAILLLASHRLWSMAQVSLITGAKKGLVAKLMSKSDHTGGRLNPASFDLILEEIELRDRNESNVFLTARILDDGTSSYMLAALLNQSVSTIKYRANKGRELAA